MDIRINFNTEELINKYREKRLHLLMYTGVAYAILVILNTLLTSLHPVFIGVLELPVYVVLALSSFIIIESIVSAVIGGYLDTNFLQKITPALSIFLVFTGYSVLVADQATTVFGQQTFLGQFIFGTNSQKIVTSGLWDCDGKKVKNMVDGKWITTQICSRLQTCNVVDGIALCVNVECDFESDCADGNHYTLDRCVENKCVYERKY